MIGRVGTCFGTKGINIVSAAVGRPPEAGDEADGGLAVMVITTDSPVPSQVLDELLSGEGFVAARTVALEL
jgi:D-3-phosphoglycerate dehydrogenase